MCLKLSKQVGGAQLRGLGPGTAMTLVYLHGFSYPQNGSNNWMSISEDWAICQIWKSFKSFTLKRVFLFWVEI